MSSIFNFVKDAENKAEQILSDAKDTISAERKAAQDDLGIKSAVFEDKLNTIRSELYKHEKEQINDTIIMLDKEWHEEKMLYDKKYEVGKDNLRAHIKGKVLAKWR